MPKKLEEITATWGFEKFRFESAGGDMLIGECHREDGTTLTVKANEEGEPPSNHPQRHQTYRWYGSWTNYTNRRTGQSERQFQAKTFVQCQPHGRAGIVAYLAKAPGIGRVIAGRLWQKFESQAVRILREQPDVASAAVQRLSLDVAQIAAEWLDREKTLEACTIDLIDLLDGRGFPKQTSKEAVRIYSNQAAAKIRANPYLLMRFRGCGFKRADSLYLDLGHPPGSLKRQALCAWHAIASQSSGDTWHYVDVAKRGIDGAIGGAEPNAAKALRVAIRGGILEAKYTDGPSGPIDEWTGDCLWLADARKAAAERRLAGYAAEAMAEDVQWPDVDEITDISGHQRERLDQALQGPLAILGGGPGTGKTFTAARLLRVLVAIFGSQQIGVMAPTGKAAVRLTEAMHEYQVPLKARTVHSTLRVKSADDGWTFEHNAANPLPYKALVVDEVSMLDTTIAASLFAARAKGTLVLLIGDVNQLAPVAHGAPLRDLIAAGVPYGELTEIRRNSGTIVECCKSIREGRGLEIPRMPTRENLRLNACSKPEHQIDTMLAVLDSYRTGGLDPVWDCQVLCAVNQKSDLARKKLNKILQNHLNANPEVKGSPFRLADKVVNTKNGWYPAADAWAEEHQDALASDQEVVEEIATDDRGRIYVANGELGQVVEVGPKHIVVLLSAPMRAVLVPRGEASEGDDDEESATGTGCNWDLGYALSVHRFQGSETPIAIVMVDDSAGAARVCDRAWIYTAISRAKQTCYLVGRESVAQGFTRKNNIDKRRTFLREMVEAEVSQQKGRTSYAVSQ